MTQQIYRPTLDSVSTSRPTTVSRPDFSSTSCLANTVLLATACNLNLAPLLSSDSYLNPVAAQAEAAAKTPSKSYCPIGFISISPILRFQYSLVSKCRPMMEWARLSIKVLVGSSISIGQNQHSTWHRFCKVIFMSIINLHYWHDCNDISPKPASTQQKALLLWHNRASSDWGAGSGTYFNMTILRVSV